MFADTILGHALVVIDGSRRSAVTVLKSRDGRLYLRTDYPDGVAARDLADEAFSSYYEEVSAAADGDGRLLAIARLIRRLHVMHLFDEANGRVNVYLLLPRLLLEHGFQPFIHPDMGAMFNGGWTLDNIVAALRQGQNETIPRLGARLSLSAAVRNTAGPLRGGPPFPDATAVTVDRFVPDPDDPAPPSAVSPAAELSDGRQPRVIATRSGYLIPRSRAEDAADDGADLVAAHWFPAVGGAMVLHVHMEQAGRFMVDGRALTAGEFHEQVVRHLDQPPGQILIVVACWGALVPPDGPAPVALLAGLGDRPVLGADAEAFTMDGGRVVTARSGLDADSRPVLDATARGHWVLLTAGERAEFGHDLLDVLVRQARRLAASLPAGVAAPVVQGRPGGPRRPALLRDHPDYQPPQRAVLWSDPGTDVNSPATPVEHVGQDEVDAAVRGHITSVAQMRRGASRGTFPQPPGGPRRRSRPWCHRLGPGLVPPG